MLILTRQLGEAIVIETPQGRVTIYLAYLDRGKVRLAFDADKSIPINRAELVTQYQAPVFRHGGRQ